MSATQNLEIKEKVDRTIPFGYNTGTRTLYTPVDITGYTAKFQVTPSGSGTPVELTCGSGITLPTPANGLFLVDVETGAGRYDFQFGFWEFEIIAPSGKTEERIDGDFTLRKQRMP